MAPEKKIINHYHSEEVKWPCYKANLIDTTFYNHQNWLFKLLYVQYTYICVWACGFGHTFRPMIIHYWYQVVSVPLIQSQKKWAVEIIGTEDCHDTHVFLWVDVKLWMCMDACVILCRWRKASKWNWYSQSSSTNCRPNSIRTLSCWRKSGTKLSEPLHESTWVMRQTVMSINTDMDSESMLCDMSVVCCVFFCVTQGLSVSSEQL